MHGTDHQSYTHALQALWTLSFPSVLSIHFGAYTQKNSQETNCFAHGKFVCNAMAAVAALP